MEHDNIYRFPIGRVVREHRVRMAIGGSAESQAIDTALRSVGDAIKSLQRQRSSLLLRYRAARMRETADEEAQAMGRTMGRILRRQAEDEQERGEDQGGAA